MDENKITNGENGAKTPAPPPAAPKKESDNVKKNKKGLILIPIIAAIIITAVIVAVVLKNIDKDASLKPITVTDTNGVPFTDEQGEPVTIVPVIVTNPQGETVTDEQGEPVTAIPVIVTDPQGDVVTNVQGAPVIVVPETEIHEYTNAQGEKQTTVVYKDIIVNVPVTDNKGEKVTDKNGETVTEQIVVKPTEPSTQKGEVVTTPAGEVVTTIKSEPVTKPNGEVVTTMKSEVVTTPEGEKVTTPDGEVETTMKSEVVTTTRVEVVTTMVDTTTQKPGVSTTNKKEDKTTQSNKESQNNNVPTTQKKPAVTEGSTAVPVTDGQGHTTIDGQGNVVTTVVEVTTMPPANVETADIEWKTSIGGTAADYVSSIATLKDGSYITATVTNSIDGDFSKYKEFRYASPYTVFTKYSKNGDVIWQNALGSKKGATVITSVVALEDGGFYAVGYGKNIGGVTGKGYYDGCVFKFDKKGEQLWYNTFGTSTVDLFNGATLTRDGGIIAVGSVGNNDIDASGFGKPKYESAAAIVKFNSAGAVVWKDIIGGNKDTLTNVVEATDGSIFCVGNFYSNEIFKNAGQADSGLIKYSADGKFVNVRSISGTGNEEFKGITACKDGGVVIVGRSNSSDAGTTDSFFVSDLASRGGYDAYIVKCDKDLTVIFARTFRGQNNDSLNCVVETEDGAFIAAGESNSSTRDLKGVTTRGGNDIIVVSFNKYGDLSWARSFGGTKNESANAISLAEKGGYIVAGRTFSKDIDMKGITQYVTDKSVGVIVKFPE